MWYSQVWKVGGIKPKNTSSKTKLSKNLQWRSKMYVLSLESTSLVFLAWHVNAEFKSFLCTDGHKSRFSITSPELCSYTSSNKSPLWSHLTSGWGRPIKKKN